MVIWRSPFPFPVPTVRPVTQGTLSLYAKLAPAGGPSGGRSSAGRHRTVKADGGKEKLTDGRADCPGTDRLRREHAGAPPAAARNPRGADRRDRRAERGERAEGGGAVPRPGAGAGLPRPRRDAPAG